MGPPSAGGILLNQLFSFTELYQKNLAKIHQPIPRPLTSEFFHALAQRLALSFQDRADFLGDPDFVKIPIKQILSQEYIENRWRIFNPQRYSDPEVRDPRNPLPKETHNTTHFSVVDREGNAVAMTLTVNDLFGSGFTPPETGVVMNNQMNDFSLEPGTANMYGLVGTSQNAVAPNKRPLSNMSPTIVMDSSDRVRWVLGASGGPRIITSVYYTLLLSIQYQIPLLDAVAMPRIHHQWQPKTLFAEALRMSPTLLEDLTRNYGYHLENVGSLARIHAIEISPEGRRIGAPDPRGEGATRSE